MAEVADGGFEFCGQFGGFCGVVDGNCLSDADFELAGAEPAALAVHFLQADDGDGDDRDAGFLGYEADSRAEGADAALEMARAFTAIFKPLGFHYVTLDLEGYRQGSLNAVLAVENH